MAQPMHEGLYQQLQSQIADLQGQLDAQKKMHATIFAQQDDDVRYARQLAADWLQLSEDYEALKPASPISAYEAWDKRRLALKARTEQMLREVQ